jgi:glycosyltransferase involved in cell wall biosynthesis
MPARADSALPVVGLSSNVLEPAFSGGRLDGIGIYTLALERGLRRLGVSTRRIGAPVRQGRRFVRPTLAEASFRWPMGWALGATALLRGLTPGADGVERAVDVFHATDYLVPKLRRTPVVATIYDAIPLAHPEWANQSLRRVKNALLLRAASHADMVVAISHAAVDEIVEHYRIPRERIRVVHLGVDEDFLEPTPAEDVEALRASRGIRPGCLLFVGTLQPRKNLGTLLAAYDRLPASVRAEHPLVVAGKFGWGAEDVRADLEARRARGEVKWLDYVSRAELRALYSTARAFLFPSLAEGFGLPVLEALAAGTAVVASDLPVLREVAGNAATFVPPHDVEAWTQSMRDVASHAKQPIDAESRRAHARRFRWDACAAATLAAYQEVRRAIA